MTQKMRFYYFLVILFNTKTSMPLPTSTHSSTGPIEVHNIEHIRVHNKTEAPTNPDSQNLESKQISDEEDDGYDYPVVTKKEAEYKSSISEQIDLNQLKLKCIHLEKLLNLNKPPNKPSGYEQYQEDYRPIYITTQRTTPRSTYTSVTRPSSFYITVPTPGNSKMSIPASSAIKYIRLEPVILQKTILSNGRTVYYWHKNLPTAVEYPSGINYESPAKEEPYQSSYNYGYNPFYSNYYNPNFYVPPSASYYYPGNQNVSPAKITEATTEQVTTTTTEESGFGLSNFIPFYGSSGDSTSTTTEPSTSTSVKYEKSDDLLYGQQYKFVVPYSYDEALTRQSWGYPYLHSQTGIPQDPTNFRLPYGPQFQYVKAVVVPKVQGKIDDKEDVN